MGTGARPGRDGRRLRCAIGPGNASTAKKAERRHRLRPTKDFNRGAVRAVQRDDPAIDKRGQERCGVQQAARDALSSPIDDPNRVPLAFALANVLGMRRPASRGLFRERMSFGRSRYHGRRDVLVTPG